MIRSVLLFTLMFSYLAYYCSGFTFKNIHSPSNKMFRLHSNQKYQLSKSIIHSKLKDDDSLSHATKYDIATLVYSSFKSMDEMSDGWILSYANTSPYNITEPVGQLFLITNAIYVISGLYTVTQGYTIQSALIEFAGILSLNYHYKQLVYGQENIEVKKALALDYIGALTAIFFITQEVIHQTLIGSPPIYATILAVCGGISLFISWIYADDVPLRYIFYHGLWHLLSGLAYYELYSTIT